MGLNVGVGTDGPASNNDLDMFEETRLAALLAKTASNDPTVLPARQALELATIGGARAMHMGDVTGSLEAGKRADIAILDVSGMHNQPQFQHNPGCGLLAVDLRGEGSDVAHVLCNGRWLLRDGALLTIDEETTYQRGRGRWPNGSMPLSPSANQARITSWSSWPA